MYSFNYNLNQRNARQENLPDTRNVYSQSNQNWAQQNSYQNTPYHAFSAYQAFNEASSRPLAQEPLQYATSSYTHLQPIQTHSLQYEVNTNLNTYSPRSETALQTAQNISLFTENTHYLQQNAAYSNYRHEVEEQRTLQYEITDNRIDPIILLAGDNSTSLQLQSTAHSIDTLYYKPYSKRRIDSYTTDIQNIRKRPTYLHDLGLQTAQNSFLFTENIQYLQQPQSSYSSYEANELQEQRSLQPDTQDNSIALRNLLLGDDSTRLQSNTSSFGVLNGDLHTLAPEPEMIIHTANSTDTLYHNSNSKRGIDSNTAEIQNSRKRTTTYNIEEIITQDNEIQAHENLNQESADFEISSVNSFIIEDNYTLQAETTDPFIQQLPETSDLNFEDFPEDIDAYTFFEFDEPSDGETLEHQSINFHSQNENTPPQHIAMDNLNKELEQKNLIEQLTHLDNLNTEEIAILGKEIIDNIINKKELNPQCPLVNIISFKELIIIARYSKGFNKAAAFLNVSTENFKSAMTSFGLLFKELAQPQYLPISKLENILNDFGREFEKDFLSITLVKIMSKMQKTIITDPFQLISLISESDSLTDFSLRLKVSYKKTRWMVRMNLLKTIQKNYPEFLGETDLSKYTFNKLKKICICIVNHKNGVQQENLNTADLTQDIQENLETNLEDLLQDIDPDLFEFAETYDVVTMENQEINFQNQNAEETIPPQNTSRAILDSALKDIPTIDGQLNYLFNLNEDQLSNLIPDIENKIQRHKELYRSSSLVEILSFEEFIILARNSKNLKNAQKSSKISFVNIQDSLAYFGLSFMELANPQNSSKSKFEQILNYFGREFEKDFIFTTLEKILKKLPKKDVTPSELISLLSKSHSLQELSIKLYSNQRNAKNMAIKVIQENYFEFLGETDLKKKNDFKILKEICTNIVRDPNFHQEETTNSNAIPVSIANSNYSFLNTLERLDTEATVQPSNPYENFETFTQEEFENLAHMNIYQI